ncbi:MAG: TonB family protein [Capsulimonadaceae bacterium]|nr:TonB family protein [Capsulimonadaceae bacterium]
MRASPLLKSIGCSLAVNFALAAGFAHLSLHDAATAETVYTVQLDEPTADKRPAARPAPLVKPADIPPRPAALVRPVAPQPPASPSPIKAPLRFVPARYAPSAQAPAAMSSPPAAIAACPSPAQVATEPLASSQGMASAAPPSVQPAAGRASEAPPSAPQPSERVVPVQETIRPPQPPPPVQPPPARHGDTHSARIVRRSDPEYPADARRDGVEGTVALRVAIGASGAVKGIYVTESSGDNRLDRAATETVARWQFAPRMEDGVPVETQMKVRVKFNLDD